MKLLLPTKIILALTLTFLFGCTKQVSFNSWRPAKINVPSHIKTILIVDRTEYKNVKLGILESVLTGEGIYEDRNGIEEAITAFQNKLSISPRFEMKRSNERLIGNSMLGIFPEPLNWNIVSEQCKKYQTDAIVAIEVFDTNFIITDGKRNVKKTIEKDGQKKEVDVMEFYAEGIGSCKIGFRIYDPSAKSIADQQMFSKSYTWQGTGSSIRDAYATLIQKSEATKYTSRLAGSDYAEKIAPMPIRISRTFYAKPKKNQYLASGARLAEVNQWEEAIETWKKGISFTGTKTAGKISYNIAVAYEVIGDLSMAKEWANKSYVNYGNKQARDYSSQLNYRMRNDALVKQQMQ